MTPLDIETINELKTQRIEKLLEQVLLDTVLSTLYKLAEIQKQKPRSVCYKSDCPARDEIPF